MLFALRMQVLMLLLNRAYTDLPPADFIKFAKEVNRGS